MRAALRVPREISGLGGGGQKMAERHDAWQGQKPMCDYCLRRLWLCGLFTCQGYRVRQVRTLMKGILAANALSGTTSLGDMAIGVDMSFDGDNGFCQPEKMKCLWPVFCSNASSTMLEIDYLWRIVGRERRMINSKMLTNKTQLNAVIACKSSLIATTLFYYVSMMLPQPKYLQSIAFPSK